MLFTSSSIYNLRLNSVLTFISSTERRAAFSFFCSLQNKTEIHCMYFYSLSLWVRAKESTLLPYSIFLLFHFYINTHSWMPCANWKFYRSHKTHKSINLTYNKKLFFSYTYDLKWVSNFRVHFLSAMEFYEKIFF